MIDSEIGPGTMLVPSDSEGESEPVIVRSVGIAAVTVRGPDRLRTVGRHELDNRLDDGDLEVVSQLEEA